MPMFSSRRWVPPALATASLLAFEPGPAAARATPAPVPPAALATGFSDTVAASVALRTDLAPTPDGRMLVTTKAGQLRVIKNGSLLATPALNLTTKVCSGGERGLLGVAVDPKFSTNHWVYLFYTTRRLGCTNAELAESRISRFTLAGDSAALSSEKVLADHIPSPRAHHLAGDLIAASGYLYATVGDGFCHYDGTTVDISRCAGDNDNGRSLALPLGKVLRLTTGGAVPTDNPYAGSRRCVAPAGVQPGTGPCAEIFATGLCNPFRFTKNPATGKIYINDVGQETWEEIDVLTKGADYGWNVREGFCARGETSSGTGQGSCSATPPQYTNPIHAYNHTAGCSSITGGAFAPSSWPAPYGGSYFFADYVCGGIFRLVPAGGGTFTEATFASGLGKSSAITLQAGSWGGKPALFYATFDGGGQVHAIVPRGGNSAPVAGFTATTGGTGNRTVSFDGSASYDPDSGDRVASWAWRFGDGKSTTSTTPTVSHTYATAGPYDVRLVVTDSRDAASAALTKRVVAGNAAPAVSITSPSPSALFAVGQSVSLTATATDAEDGRLNSSIRWRIVLHHRDHDHPLKDATGASTSIAYPIPEGFAATEVSYVQASASVTDSKGATTTVSQRLLPQQVDLHLGSSPTGAQLSADGTLFTTPANLVSWEGWAFAVSAADQSIGGTSYVYESWSDGGARTHTVTTGNTSFSVSAAFAQR